MADNAAMDPAAAKAAANAFSQFVTEDFTLFAVGVAVTITRTFARVKHVGFKGLQGDDYLVWLAAVSSDLHLLQVDFFTNQYYAFTGYIRSRDSSCLFRRQCGKRVG